MIYFQGMKATKREKIKLEQISREYRQIPKEKDADDFAYKNMKKAIEKLEGKRRGLTLWSTIKKDKAELKDL